MSVSDFNEDRTRLTARYTPAQLGGSYVVSLSEAASQGVEPTDRISVARPDDAERQGDGAPRVSFVMVPRHHQMPRKTRVAIHETIQAVCSEIFGMVDFALEAKSPEEWRERALGCWEDFDEQMRVLRHHAKLVGLDEKVKKLSEDEKCKALFERFPDSVEEIRFLRSIVASATKRTRAFKRPAEEHSAQDFQYAAQFYEHGVIYGICMVTLDYIARRELDVSPAIIAAIFDFAREEAFEYSHFSLEGERLRRAPESESTEAGPTSLSIYENDLVEAEKAIRRFEGGAKV